MKAVIKLLIVAIVLNAVVRGGMAAANYYELKDETEQLIRFGAGDAPAQLQNSILDKAHELDLPLSVENIDVRRDGLRTVARASYTQPVEVFPRYKYPVNFSFEVEGVSLQGLGPATKR